MTSTVTRTVRIGGMSKPELLAALRNLRIELNDAGRTLFAHVKFTTASVVAEVEAVELSVATLGFVQGATSARIISGSLKWVCRYVLSSSARI